jgi:hypothetical protein
MTKLQHHIVAVEGRGEFPVDMLRRDDLTYHGLVPLGFWHNPVRVTLATTYDRSAHWEPTYLRWASFGWRVVELNGKPIGDAAGVPKTTPPMPDSLEFLEAYRGMLEALKDAVQVVPVAGRLHPQDLVALQTRLLAAIAKAEGR